MPNYSIKGGTGADCVNIKGHIVLSFGVIFGLRALNRFNFSGIFIKDALKIHSLFLVAP